MRAEDAEGTPTQSHKPPIILFYENDYAGVKTLDYSGDSEGFSG